jgi:hypothetical protein
MSEIEELLDADGRAVLADYWWRRAEGELTSWVAFQHVLADLAAERAPAALLALAERAVGDELRHSQWCTEWALRFGHAPGQVRVRSERTLTFPGASPDENRVLRIAFCCFTETVGAFTLRLARPRLRAPALRKLNQRHAADELQHARVGWGYLSTLDERRRDVIRRRLPALMQTLQVVSSEGPEEARDDLVAHGYFTPRLLREAWEGATTEVIAPGLRHLGITEAS